MGVHIAYDPVNDVAAMYDSMSGQAFGPIFDGDEGPERMEAWILSLEKDPRYYTEHELRELRAQWTLDNPRREELVDEHVSELRR